MEAKVSCKPSSSMSNSHTFAGFEGPPKKHSTNRLLGRMSKVQAYWNCAPYSARTIIWAFLVQAVPQLLNLITSKLNAPTILLQWAAVGPCTSRILYQLMYTRDKFRPLPSVEDDVHANLQLLQLYESGVVLLCWCLPWTFSINLAVAATVAVGAGTCQWLLLKLFTDSINVAMTPRHVTAISVTQPNQETDKECKQRETIDGRQLEERQHQHQQHDNIQSVKAPGISSDIPTCHENLVSQLSVCMQILKVLYTVTACLVALSPVHLSSLTVLWTCVSWCMTTAAPQCVIMLGALQQDDRLKQLKHSLTSQLRVATSDMFTGHHHGQHVAPASRMASRGTSHDSHGVPHGNAHGVVSKNIPASRAGSAIISHGPPGDAMPMASRMSIQDNASVNGGTIKAVHGMRNVSLITSVSDEVSHEQLPNEREAVSFSVEAEERISGTSQLRAGTGSSSSSDSHGHSNSLHSLNVVLSSSLYSSGNMARPPEFCAQATVETHSPATNTGNNVDVVGDQEDSENGHVNVTTGISDHAGGVHEDCATEQVSDAAPVATPPPPPASNNDSVQISESQGANSMCDPVNSGGLQVSGLVLSLDEAQKLQEEMQAMEQNVAILQHRSAAWQQYADQVIGAAYRLSAELTNPVNGVLAFTQSLAQGKHGDMSKSGKDQLGLVRACAHQSINMLAMYADMLAAARPRCETPDGSGPDAPAPQPGTGPGAELLSVKMEKVKVDKLVQQAVERMSPVAGSKIRLRSSVDSNVEAWADEKRLYQVIHLLVANAIKFAKHGDVNIQSQVAEDGERLILRVVDSGPGFKQEQLDTYNSTCSSMIDTTLEGILHKDPLALIDAQYLSSSDIEFQDPDSPPNRMTDYGLGLKTAAFIISALGGRLSVQNNASRTDDAAAPKTGACAQIVINLGDYKERTAAKLSMRRGNSKSFAGRVGRRAALDLGRTPSSTQLHTLDMPRSMSACISMLQAKACSAASAAPRSPTHATNVAEPSSAAATDDAGNSGGSGAGHGHVHGPHDGVAAVDGSGDAVQKEELHDGDDSAASPKKQQAQQASHALAVKRRRRLLSSVPPGARTAPMRANKMSTIADEASPLFAPDDASKPCIDNMNTSMMDELLSAHNNGAIGGRTAHVLMVTSNAGNATMLEEMLVGAGHTCTVATDGSSALMCFMSSDAAIQVVVMDAVLPDMKGSEVCQKMLTLCPGVPPPIILISSSNKVTDVVDALQGGASDWLVKPLRPAELLARIHAILRQQASLQQLQDTAERNMLLLSHVLPGHVLTSLQGGSRILVEKFSDVCVMHAEVIGVSSLMSSANSADCVATINQMFSMFDRLADEHGVHKVDSVGFTYSLSVGHEPEDLKRTAAGQLSALLQCGKDMLQVVLDMPYPETLGKMELRIGIHAGPLAAGVLGVKFPRYCFFGSTQRLSVALSQAAPPMCMHISEMVYNRLKGSVGRESDYQPFTLSSFQGMGIIRTYLVVTEWLDTAALAVLNIPEYVQKVSSNESESLQVMQGLVLQGGDSRTAAAALNKQTATTMTAHVGVTSGMLGGMPNAFDGAGTGATALAASNQRYEALMSGLGSGGVTGIAAAGGTGKEARLSTAHSHVSQSSVLTSATGMTSQHGRGVGDLFKAAMAGNVSTDSGGFAAAHGFAGARPLSTGGLSMIRSGNTSQNGSLNATSQQGSKTASQLNLQDLIHQHLSGAQAAAAAGEGGGGSSSRRRLSRQTTGTGRAAASSKNGSDSVCDVALQEDVDQVPDLATITSTSGLRSNPMHSMGGNSWGVDEDVALLSELGMNRFSSRSGNDSASLSPAVSFRVPRGPVTGGGVMAVAQAKLQSLAAATAAQPCQVGPSTSVTHPSRPTHNASSNNLASNASERTLPAAATSDPDGAAGPGAAPAVSNGGTCSTDMAAQYSQSDVVGGVSPRLSERSGGGGGGSPTRGPSWYGGVTTPLQSNRVSALIPDMDATSRTATTAASSTSGSATAGLQSAGGFALSANTLARARRMQAGPGKATHTAVPAATGGDVGVGGMLPADGPRHQTSDYNAAACEGPGPCDGGGVCAEDGLPAAYASIQEMMDALGCGYYAKALIAKGLNLQALATMDDDALRKAGIVTAKARKQVQDELSRIGVARSDTEAT